MATVIALLGGCFMEMLNVAYFHAQKETVTTIISIAVAYDCLTILIKAIKK